MGRTQRDSRRRVRKPRRDSGAPQAFEEGLPGRRQGEPGREERPAAPSTDTTPSSAVNLGRHAAKCRVCNHPDRLAIEFDFLNWRNPFEIAKSYRLGSLSTIYRHAHATGLFDRRRLNLRFALERIVERVGEVPVTASAVIRAVRAITRMNDAGEWIEPPPHVVISRGAPSASRTVLRDGPPQPPRPAAPAPVFDPPLLEEPSPSSASAAEGPEANAEKAAPPKRTIVELVLSPELAAAREKQRQAQARQVAQSSKNLIANGMHSPEKPND